MAKLKDQCVSYFIISLEFQVQGKFFLFKWNRFLIFFKFFSNSSIPFFKWLKFKYHLFGCKQKFCSNLIFGITVKSKNFVGVKSYWLLRSFFLKWEYPMIVGRGQVVRLRVLVPPFGGSNPSAPETVSNKLTMTFVLFFNHFLGWCLPVPSCPFLKNTVFETKQSFLW